MKIIELATDELIPYKNNPRNNAPAVKAVAESIKQFGSGYGGHFRAVQGFKYIGDNA